MYFRSQKLNLHLVLPDLPSLTSLLRNKYLIDLPVRVVKMFIMFYGPCLQNTLKCEIDLEMPFSCINMEFMNGSAISRAISD